MLSPRPSQVGSALAALAALAVLAFAPSASADLGHRFIGNVHGGAGTDAGGGVTLELRLLDDIGIGAWFDVGVNLDGTHGRYTYYSPALTGSYRFKLGEGWEMRPMAGARFPFGLTPTKDSPYAVAVGDPVAFFGALRLAYFFDWFMLGIKGEVTPHTAKWTELTSRTTENTNELSIRAALVLGVALGKDTP